MPEAAAEPALSREQKLCQRFYPESHFGGLTRVDGTVAFYSRVHSMIGDDTVVLDVGCGRGRYEDDPIAYRRNLRILRGKAERIIGIDVDPAAQTNPHIDEFRLIDGPRWDIEDESIDLAISDFVLEHVEDADHYFAEVARVLKPGGVFVARTPNKAGYVAIIARFVPNRLHARMVGRAQANRKPEDVFPTFYRCNTRRRFRQLFEAHGFDSDQRVTTSEPTYLGFSGAAYALGVLHQRMAPQALGLVIIAMGRKR